MKYYNFCLFFQKLASAKILTFKQMLTFNTLVVLDLFHSNGLKNIYIVFKTAAILSLLEQVASGRKVNLNWGIRLKGDAA